MRKAIKSQVPYLKMCPESAVSNKLKTIALKFLRFNPQEEKGLELFLERLINF